MKAFYQRLLDHEIPTSEDIYYSPFSGKGFWLRPINRLTNVQYFNFFDKNIQNTKAELSRVSAKLDNLEAILK